MERKIYLFRKGRATWCLDTALKVKRMAYVGRANVSYSVLCLVRRNWLLVSLSISTLRSSAVRYLLHTTHHSCRDKCAETTASSS